MGSNTKYLFDYSIHENEISFEFEDEHVKDITYTFSTMNDTIILVESNGITSYTLKKSN